MTPSIKFVELDKAAHDRKRFDCGKTVLNDFIHQSAVRHRSAGISKTMVLPTISNTEDKADICSYYTLSHTEIKRETLPSTLAKKLPRYPVPVLLIAQLAVHRKMQGQGLGKVTLIRALQHCLEIHTHLPSFSVVVDALDADIELFYQQYGFQSLGMHHGRMRLFLPMQTIIQLLSYKPDDLKNL